MPLTTSSTDKAIYALIKSMSKQYRPESTNSKPMHNLEKLFVQALHSAEIKTCITEYVLQHADKY